MSLVHTENKITPYSTAAADEHLGHAKVGTPGVTTIGELGMLDALLKISDGDTSFFMFAIGQNALRRGDSVQMVGA